MSKQPSWSVIIPCPFCGHADMKICHYPSGDNHPWVSCESCWARGPASKLAVDAIEAWNRRADAPPNPSSQKDDECLKEG